MKEYEGRAPEKVLGSKPAPVQNLAQKKILRCEARKGGGQRKSESGNKLCIEDRSRWRLAGRGCAENLRKNGKREK